MTSKAGNLNTSVDEIQRSIADYAYVLDYGHFPDDVIHTAKARIVDTLGVLWNLEQANAADIPPRFVMP